MKYKSKPLWVNNIHVLEWLLTRRQEIASVGKDVKGWGCVLLGMWIGAATLENSMEVPHKTKNRSSIWSSNGTAGYLCEENKHTHFKISVHPHVHCSSSYHSWDEETVQVFMDEWIMKLWSTMEYYSPIKRNEILPFVTT